MAETYLNLMNTNAQVAANVHEQIDRSMTQSIALEAQQGQFLVNTMGKAAQFAEQQRINDEQIINMRADNYMQAQRFEAEKMLIPIRMEEANLRLESQRLGLQRQKEMDGKNHFNSLTSIYDDQIGYSLLETQSTDMAREYLGFKAQVSDYVAKGGKFDSKKFEEGLNVIRGKYKDVRPVGAESIEYSPETNYLLEQVSPKIGAAYAQRHPAVQGSRNSLAVSYYSSESAKDAGEFSRYNRLYNQEELGQIAVGRNVVLRNKKIIEQDSKQADYVRNQLAVASTNPAIDPKSLTTMQENLNRYENNVRNAMVENDALITNAAMGKFGPVQALQLTNRPPADTKTDKKFSLEGYANPDSTMGVSSPKTPDMNTTGQQMKSGIDKTFIAVAGVEKNEKGDFVPIQDWRKTELSEVDLSWYNKSGTGEAPDMDSRNLIRERVELGVEKLRGQNGDINDIATRDKIESLFNTIDKDVEIPVTPWLRDTLNKAKSNVVNSYTKKDSPYSQFGVQEDDGPSVVKFGPEKSKISEAFSGTSIQNADQLFKEVNKIKDPTKKKEALGELYSALTAASLTSGLTNKDK